MQTRKPTLGLQRGVNGRGKSLSGRGRRGPDGASGPRRPCHEKDRFAVIRKAKRTGAIAGPPA